jgi:hypothetical protein
VCVCVRACARVLARVFVNKHVYISLTDVYEESYVSPSCDKPLEDSGPSVYHRAFDSYPRFKDF